MLFSTLKRGTALTVTAAMCAAVTATAVTAAPRAAVRPGAQAVNPRITAGSEQVLSEGGAASAYYIGNLMDIVGDPIACPGTSFARNCAAELDLPTKAATNPQYLYAANGAGAAQLDFVSQQSGVGGKTAQSPAPVFADALDAYSNTSPIGFTSGWAGTASSTVAEDTIHFAAGDAPIPLGPAENAKYVPSGFVDYSDSLAAYNGDGIVNGGGYNHNRGPAVVEPILATSISIIFNNSGLTIPSGGLNLTQDDLCGIFTGVYTNWNQTSANPGNQAITIVHRSDGSGNTFLLSYDLSKMCSATNPAIGAGVAGAPNSAEFWGTTTNVKTQGVGTDSNNFLSGNVIPTDTTAPEVVWPAASVGVAKSSGELSAVSSTTGAIGYVSPAYTTSTTISEANVENYEGGYEPATASTVAASISTFVKGTSGEPNPAGYPKATSSAALYFPYPTSSTGDALVGFSYAYFYKCSPTRQAVQLAAIKKLFEYETTTNPSNAAAVAAFWNFTALPSAELSLLKSAVTLLKDTAVTNGSYTNPATGATAKYSCTAT